MILPRLVGHPAAWHGEFPNADPRIPYPQEFREQSVALHRAGRSLEELAKEVEPCAATIRSGVKQAELDAGRRTDVVSNVEREELRRLRRENRRLRHERDIFSKAVPARCRRPRIEAGEDERRRPGPRARFARADP